jgi:hypothetical protein
VEAGNGNIKGEGLFLFAPDIIFAPENGALLIN